MTAFLAPAAAAEPGTEILLPEDARPGTYLRATDDALYVGSRSAYTTITKDKIFATHAPDPGMGNAVSSPPAHVGDLQWAPTNEVTFHGGAWSLDENGRLWRRPIPAFEAIRVNSTNRVHGIARAQSGELWCATQEGVARLDAELRVQTFDKVLGQTLGIVTAIDVDRDGSVWIGSGSSFTGVYRRDPGGGWHHFGADEGFVDAYVHGITADHATGAVWFSVLNAPGAAMDAGLGAWLFSGERFQRFPPERVRGRLPSDRVYDVVRDPSGVVWFGTLKGLAALEGDRLVPYTRAEGLRDDKVWALAAARDGSLWLGYQTGHGVTRIARGEVRHFDKSRDGLSHDEVWAVAEGRPGVMWFATPVGLDRYDGRRWSHFSTADGLPVDRLWPLLADSDGTLWIGTIGGGLVRMRNTDREAPRTTIELNGSEITWSAEDAWHATAPATIRFRYRWDDGAWSAATTGRRIAIPRDGHRRLQVQAIDRFGNMERPPPTLLLAAPAARNLFLPWMVTFSTTLLCVLLVLVARKRR
ncbi:MAG: two-component regulator propeller domain-containing protein [Planctomycetota bacterium]